MPIARVPSASTQGPVCEVSSIARTRGPPTHERWVPTRSRLLLAGVGPVLAQFTLGLQQDGNHLTVSKGNESLCAATLISASPLVSNAKTSDGWLLATSPPTTQPMTNATTPIHTMFEMQRQATKPAQQLFEQGLEIQQNATEAFLRNSMTAQRSAQKQGAELAHEVTDAQIDAFESAVDENESDFRTAMDQQFEQNAELTQDVLNSQFEQGAEFFQQLLNAQFDAFQTSLESEDFDVRATVDEQFEAYSDAQDEAWDEFEPEFLDAFEDLNEQQQQFVAQSIDAFLDAHADAERQTVEGVQQAEEAARTAQEQTEQVARTTQENAENLAEETADAAEEQVETQAEAAEESIDTLADLGTDNADLLYDQGYESIDALAEANADAVATAVGVSESEAEEWIEAAQSGI